MAKSKTNSKPNLIGIPSDPDRCFVHFSKAFPTAGTMAVSLESLANQLRKQPMDRKVSSIQLKQHIFEINFMEVEN
ncbi:hypothetical protein M5X06_30810 [Paenibacillus alvei]|uniref:Uncharacterized protein n=1 Tax=Paenibacillus alvei TaxID=44250 RepID=A0ABT4H850_PAEAL|nr:hypothetical protein [Paenibacillus alvei]MCY9765160.1 hypothetical protein [Paenibacillus alvei]MCY9771167.1 hypothetical protein [Paenibacillus alvei]